MLKMKSLKELSKKFVESLANTGSQKLETLKMWSKAGQKPILQKLGKQFPNLLPFEALNIENH